MKSVIRNQRLRSITTKRKFLLLLAPVLWLLTACTGGPSRIRSISPGLSPRNESISDEPEHRNKRLDTSEQSPPLEPEEFSVSSLPDGPLSLSEAIQIGISQNPDVQTAAHRIRIARARLGQAEAAFYPQLSAGMTYTRTTHPAEGFFMNVARREFDPAANPNEAGLNENIRTEVTIRYPIFRGGRDVNRTEAAESRIRIRKSKIQSVRNQIKFEITNAYLSILAAREQRKIAKKSLSTVKAQKDRVKKQVNQGAALKADLRSLDVRVSEARQKKISARNATRKARVALKTLLGVESKKKIRVEPKDDSSVDQSMPEDKQVFKEALDKRPEYAAARHRTQTLRERLEMAKGEQYPVLQMFGKYGHDQNSLDYSDRTDNWTAGLELNYELFSGFSTRENIREAQQKLRTARTKKRKTRLMIQKEIRNAMNRLEDRLAELEVTKNAVEASKEALRIAEARYEKGAVPITRYLEAETDVTRSRSRYQKALYDVRKARANFKRALGTYVN